MILMEKQFLGTCNILNCKSRKGDDKKEKPDIEGQRCACAPVAVDDDP